MARILAIDYGARRTGLAWTDPLRIVASGIGAVETPQLWQELQNRIAEGPVDCILLGFPTRMDGSDTHATEAVRKLERKIRQHFPALQVELWDERLTSKMAVSALIEAGVPKKKRRQKGLVDQMAATLMLQEYLSQ